MNNVLAYKTTKDIIHGSEYKNIEREARKSHNRIASHTKRNPYIKSKYFKNEKIFLNYFWNVLHQRNWQDRKRRLIYYDCAIDLLRNTTLASYTSQDPDDPNLLQHEFYGITENGREFVVHVREDKRNDRKSFMSVFPPRQKK